MANSEQHPAPPPTRLVLLRHGESQVTVDRVIGGFRSCSGLSPLGRDQTVRLRDRLTTTRELAGGRLIASNYARAIETAEIIAPAVRRQGDSEPGADFVVDARFGEHDPGPELDGVRFDDYVARYGSPGPGTEIFPGGETFADFHERIATAIADTIAAHTGELIVVSCHGGVIDAAFRQLLHLPPTGAFDLWTLNTSITEFLRADPDADSAAGARWRLVRYNDAAHLAGLPEATPR